MITVAGCVITDAYGRILLLHCDTPDKTQWELPGGKVEKDEDPEKTIKRELFEEVGVGVRLTGLLGATDSEDNEKTYHYLWYGAEIVTGEPTICEPETFDDLDYIEFEDFVSLALSANLQAFFEQVISGETDLPSIV